MAALSAGSSGLNPFSKDPKGNRIFVGPNEEKITAFQYHEDHLENLPLSCEVLANSESCGIEAFRIKQQPIWGVQFHPELILSDSKAILEGQPPPLLPWKPQTNLEAPYIIKAFAALCLKQQSRVITSLLD